MSSATAGPVPIRFHGPGWVIDLTTYDEFGDEVASGAVYQLWAPQDDVLADPYGHAAVQRKYNAEWTPRLTWAASWQSADPEDGDFRRGDSAESVLAIFPDDVRERFDATLERLAAS